jgi:hypothetical protein
VLGRGLKAAFLALALTACADLPSDGPVRPQPDRPVTPTPKPPSAESQAVRVYYASVERRLLTQGLLRTDGGGPDTPFSARNLADNFMAIALYDELVDEGGTYVAQAKASELRRWNGPIRMGMIFGASVPSTQQDKDRAEVTSYVARLSRLTGKPIRIVDTANANMDVLFLNEDERRASEPLIRARVPEISNAAIRIIRDMPRDAYCMVFAFSNGRSPIYTRAIAVIRSEHPDLLRRSCIHEELAQAMGLANDSPKARPSIFNDDEEFGLLTRHDELLLKMLYDPRLRPGMTAAEARPIVDAIASELVGGES